ncbi:MAG: hypothetical protein WD929_07440 [Steroidobacteraceae bacterium]
MASAHAWAVVVLLPCCMLAGTAEAGPGPLEQAISDTRSIGDARIRFEHVDQDPLTEDAQALTLRARLGFETGKAWETALLVEGEFAWPLISDYNSTTNGKTAYPVVADPESYEVNRLQLVNTGLPGTTVTLGRQRINLDEQRFVGNVGWRQNEQTFDSLRIVNRSLPRLTLDASWITQVNRVFGGDSLQGRYEGDSYLLNLSWQLPAGRLTGFGYWLAFDAIDGVPAAVGDSSQTLGLRFAGERASGEWKLAYAASWATQEDAGSNPSRFDNDYRLLELTAHWRKLHAGIGTEVLEGDGTKGFVTPLATLHKFQGWADKFLATPPDGIEDTYVTAGFGFGRVGPLDALSAQAGYHEYRAESASGRYGTELNLQLQIRWHRLAGTLKFADYDADTLLTDTRKFWAQLEYAW